MCCSSPTRKTNRTSLWASHSCDYCPTFVPPKTSSTGFWSDTSGLPGPVLTGCSQPGPSRLPSPRTPQHQALGLGPVLSTLAPQAW